jgi:hypothetical protein
VLVDAPFNVVTGEIIAAAIEVHRVLSPGLLESAYIPCLRYELSTRKLRFVTQRSLPIVYKEMLTYLRLAGHSAGLLINFNVPRLITGVKRLLNTR